MKKLCLLIILVTLVGILPSLLQNGCFVLATDMADQEVPFIIETKRMLMSGCPLWSWNHDIGDNFIGSYSFYTLTSPFVWLNCLFPDQWMLYGITLTLLLKMLCTGAATYAYLRKMSISAESSVIGALMYTFSYFAVSNLFYYHFLEPMIAFPLLLIAVERFLRKERYGGTSLILASFLVFFINYYFAACSVITALIYVLFRIHSREIQATPGRFAYGLLLVGIGLLLSSFILLPTLVHLKGNPRTSFNLSELHHDIMCGIERLYTLFEPKLVEGPNAAFFYYPYSSNAANIPVVGLLLAGLFALRRRSWLGGLVIVAVALYMTPLNGIFSFFTDTSYTRWAYALTLFVILASMKFVDEKQPLTTRHYWIYVAICCLGILMSYGIGMYNNYRHYGILLGRSGITLNLIIQGLFLLQMILLIAYVKRNTPSTLLRCVVVMSMVYFPVSVLMNTDYMNKSQYRTEWYGSIRQYLLDNHLPHHDGDFEWRTDFMAFYPNVSMIKNRPAISTFNSIQNSKLTQMMEAVGCKLGSNTERVVRNAVSFDALMSVKEIIEYNNYLHLSDSLTKRSPFPQLVAEPSREACLGKKHVGNGYAIYENKYYIPMGFTYDSFIGQSSIDSLMVNDPQTDIPLQLLANLAVPDLLIPLAGTVMKPGTLSKRLVLDSLVTERRKNRCATFSGNTRGFTATVNMPEKNLLFFSIVSDKGFKGYVDGVETEILSVNLGLSAVMVDQGHHKIEFRYFPRGMRAGLLMTLAGLILTFAVLLAERKQKSP